MPTLHVMVREAIFVEGLTLSCYVFGFDRLVPSCSPLDHGSPLTVARHVSGRTTCPLCLNVVVLSLQASGLEPPRAKVADESHKRRLQQYAGMKRIGDTLLSARCARNRGW